MAIFLLNDKQITRCWFQTFFYVHPENWGTFPFWLIFFKWVGSTTNEISNKVEGSAPSQFMFDLCGSVLQVMSLTSLVSLRLPQLCIKACTIGPGQQMERNSVAILSTFFCAQKIPAGMHSHEFPNKWGLYRIGWFLFRYTNLFSGLGMFLPPFSVCFVSFFFNVSVESEGTTYWCSLFSVNQWRVEEELGHGAFGKAFLPPRVTNWAVTSWWCQIFLIFTPTWGHDPIWLVFFRWVETTN